MLQKFTAALQNRPVEPVHIVVPQEQSLGFPFFPFVLTHAGFVLQWRFAQKSPVDEVQILEPQTQLCPLIDEPSVEIQTAIVVKWQMFPDATQNCPVPAVHPLFPQRQLFPFSIVPLVLLHGGPVKHMSLDA